MKRQINNFKFNQIIKATNYFSKKGNTEKVNKLYNYVLNNADNNQCLYFATNFGGIVDISKLEDRFINNGNYYELSRLVDVNGVNLDKIVDFYISLDSKNSSEVGLGHILSRNVDVKNFNKIQKHALETQNEYLCEKLAYNGNNCDIENISKIIYASDDYKLINRFYITNKKVDKKQCFEVLKNAMLNNCGNYSELVDFVKDYKSNLTNEDIENFKEKMINATKNFFTCWELEDKPEQCKQVIESIKSGEVFEL